MLTRRAALRLAALAAGAAPFAVAHEGAAVAVPPALPEIPCSGVVSFFGSIDRRDGGGFAQGAGGLRVDVAPDGRWSVEGVRLVGDGLWWEGETEWRLEGDAADAAALRLLDLMAGWVAGDGGFDRTEPEPAALAAD